MSDPSASSDTDPMPRHNVPRWLIVLAWIAAFLPALVILYVVDEYRPSVPYHDSWAFVMQYQDWTQGKVDWHQLFELHNDHPSAVGKTIYFIVMHFLRGQVGLLPLISWLMSVGISLGVLKLSRPLWQGRPLMGPALMFAANFTIFTGAQGHTWIWDFVFQNFIAGCLLVWGAVMLAAEKASWQRLAASFVMSVVCVNCFASGVFVGALLVPLVWWHVRECGTKKQLLTVSLWLLFLAVAAGVAFHKPHTGDGSVAGGSTALGRATYFMEVPWMTAQYFLSLLGLCLGQGTVIEATMLCSVAGAALLVLLCRCLWGLWKQRDAALWRQALPWLALCGYALINAALITYGRMRFTLETAIAPRYATFELFLPLGLLFLWLTVSRRSEGMAKASGSLLAVVLLMQCIGWASGLQSLLTYHLRMDEEKYALSFSNILALPPDLVWRYDAEHPTADFARFLEKSGRLRGVRFLETDEITPIKSKGVLSRKFASFEVVSHQSDGTQWVEGTCGLNKDLDALPDLVILTAQTEGAPERMVAFTMPKLPDDFFQRALLRRLHADHYFGWSIELKPGLLPVGKPVTLRAYAFDGEKRRATPMEQHLVVTAQH